MVVECRCGLCSSAANYVSVVLIFSVYVFYVEYFM